MTTLDELREKRGEPERSVEIVALKIHGCKQVNVTKVTEVLEAEGLAEGEHAQWPEDARIDRAVERLLAIFAAVAIRLIPVSRHSDRASLIVDLRERSVRRFASPR